MLASDPVRWGVLGTANIAAHAFLPALAQTDAVASVVGSRDPAGAAAWAQANEVERTSTYDEVIKSDVDAVYVALPNNLHTEWAARAAATGKAVLCEKPLGLDRASVARLASHQRSGRIWEAFAFVFHPQTTLLQALARHEAFGSCAQIDSEFHFLLGSTDNIRWSPEQGGGALYDVGCYPIRLARLVFGTEPIVAVARMTPQSRGTIGISAVDTEVAGVIDFPEDRRLLFAAGLQRFPSTFTRIIGTTGEIRVSNPFHPGLKDTVELWSGGKVVTSHPGRSEGVGTAFESAIRHINGVVRGEEPAQATVNLDAVAQAEAMDLVRAAARTEPSRTGRTQ